MTCKIELDSAKAEQNKILKAIRHIAELPTPRSTEKVLKGPLGTLWRYRNWETIENISIKRALNKIFSFLLFLN